ncbi:class I SAM-dependent methyltransferase [Nocardiopsis quinghaiensis]|uniref:class I SAM-dependent methyltransferase n=1 Tax=Nocardiopsis quinghaiensis TaxID=464995 RepID=UPI001239A215|nr:class I SAM-dependent methyltransferase [Nocardiopsis quinghaiensis]
MGDTGSTTDLTEGNRRHWDERVPIHTASAFYDLDGFRAGAEPLDRFQLDELGDVTGLDLAHLQCHIGLDTLSWARHGARVSGLDFSEPAVRTASGLAVEIGLGHRARFVAADVYDAVDALGAGAFDVVYTGTGALMWLPDIDRWARTVAGLLRPGGRLYLAEFHPLTEVLDDGDGVTAVHDYFAREARTYEVSGSYADGETETTHDTATEWHHTLGDVISAVAGAGLRVEFVHEHDTIAFRRYDALVADGARFRRPDGSARLPLTYSLAASAPAEAHRSASSYPTRATVRPHA